MHGGGSLGKLSLSGSVAERRSRGQYEEASARTSIPSLAQARRSLIHSVAAVEAVSRFCVVAAKYAAMPAPAATMAASAPIRTFKSSGEIAIVSSCGLT